MPTTADYLNDLVEQKKALATAISECGIEASEDETLNTLVPKVLNIKSSGDDRAFWNIYQDNGNRTDYNHAFAGEGWVDDTFNPKYKISPTSAYMMFRESGIETIEKKGVAPIDVLDFSSCTVMDYAFSFSAIKKIPNLSLKNCAALNNTFRSATALEEIGKIALKSDGTTTFNNTFYQCTNLKIIGKITGKIGRDISFVHSPLTAESMKNVILALADYSDEANQYHNMFSITFQNWDVLAGTNWREYVRSLGWIPA